MQVNARLPRMVSPLSSWFASPASARRFRRCWLGRAPVVLAPRDRAWRSVAPGLTEWLAIARSGLPFQIAADRRYDRSGDPRRLGRALAAGKTVFFPQIHQVLPRLMRLMVALRATFLGPFREECSFLFLAEGRGREGMGLHHDGEVDAFWLQLEGRRTITIGPPVPSGAPEELGESYARRRPGRWSTLELLPGTLFYMPPRTPHRVVSYGRSLALSLTWRTPASHRRARQHAAGLTQWDVVSGRADPIPPLNRERLWTQVPAVAGPFDRGPREFPLWLPDGVEIRLPAAARSLAARLSTMPCWRRPLTGPQRGRLSILIEQGIVAPRDLPLRIIPEDPRLLDGWRFA